MRLPKSMVNFLASYLINRAKKTPYCHIGDYMHRFWLVPYRHEFKLAWYKNPIGWILQRFDIAIRIHEILESDDTRSKHCHPWTYLSVILKGGYVEVTDVLDSDGFHLYDKKKLYTAGDVLFRRAESRHRLELFDITSMKHPNQVVTTTLFITFKKKRSWGFYPNNGEFVHYKDYLKDHVQ